MSWAGLGCTAVVAVLVAFPYLQQKQQLAYAEQVIATRTALSSAEGREAAVARLSSGPAYPDEVADAVLRRLNLETSRANREAVRSQILTPYIESGVVDIPSGGPGKGKVSLIRTPQFATVAPLYCTNRERNSSAANVREMFGTEARELTCGVTEVSIPRRHRIGEVERASIMKLEFREDPEQHVVLLSAQALGTEDFAARLKQRIGSAVSKDVLFYVPGFNVQFNDGCSRLATLAYDLGLTAAPVLFSWPSRGSLSVGAYIQDVDAAEGASASFGKVLQILTASGAQKVSIIADGLGSRVVLSALHRYAVEPGILNEVVFITPDVDVTNFADRVQVLTKTAQRVTVYTCKGCPQMVVVRKLTGAERAGAITNLADRVTGVDVVDFGDKMSSPLSHYYGSASGLLADLHGVLRGLPGDQRHALKRGTVPRTWILE